MAESEADVVPAVEEAIAREVIHLEGLAEAGGGHRPGLEVDGHGDGRIRPGQFLETPDRALGKLDGKQTDLQAVGPEDVDEARGENHLEAGVIKRPGSVG